LTPPQEWRPKKENEGYSRKGKIKDGTKWTGERGGSKNRRKEDHLCVGKKEPQVTLRFAKLRPTVKRVKRLRSDREKGGAQEGKEES